MKFRFLVPLALSIVLIGFLAVGLKRDPRDLPSPLIDKAAPSFDLPQLAQPELRFSPAQMRGKVWVLNVWASWCPACRDEHPVLMQFARTKTAPLIGLDYKDQAADALKVLRQHGDPYDLSALDRDGRVGIDYGVYGVPETYIIDRNGVIRHKHTGPVTAESLEKTLIPIIQRLNQS